VFYNYVASYWQQSLYKFYNRNSVENHIFTYMTLHYSKIYSSLRLLTIYHQVTLKNYLETMPWRKAAFYLSDRNLLISIWRAGRSNGYMVDCLKMTYCESKTRLNN